jgi:Tfp pilus assembly protein FimT
MRAHAPDSRMARSSRGFTLVLTLIMVALLAIIAVGFFTSVSLERVTARSYEDRYQAELAAQNGLEAVKQTLAAMPFPSPAPSPSPSSVTSSDTFLVVRADNGSAAYYYLAQPSTGTTPTITYYPLFSSSTNPSAPAIQTQTINLTAQNAPNPQNPTKPFAPLVPAPSPPADSSASDFTSAWNAAKTQRVPTLYSWSQPSPSPSGPSVKWVEMRDPQDAPSPAPHNLPYTRYAYWAEDLDGYLDASQVNDPNAVNARANGTSNGTSPSEIPMFTIFAPTQQIPAPNPTPVTNLVSNRSLLFTVPTVQQIAQTTPDLAGPNLAVRLGIDTAEQNLVPLGYGYGRNDTNQIGEGYPKTPINPVSQLGLNGNQAGKFGNLTTVMPTFVNRPGTGGQTRNYLNNLSANLLDYAFPFDSPTEFMPPGNPGGPPSYRGIGAYPFVVSVYDLNNWVATVPIGTTYQAVIETTTYVQLWNPHNFPSDGLAGALMVHYQNSDKVSVNGTLQTLSSPPDATIIFKDNPNPNDRTNPVIVSSLFETGNLNQPFNYLIKAANGYQDPKGKIKPNEYRVVALPGPTPGCIASGRTHYSATGLPPGLSVHGGGAKAGLIDGTPTFDSNVTYTNGYHDYSVSISARTSCGTASATMVIRIYQ